MGLKTILLGAKRRTEKISAPELGADVYLRRLNGNERERYQAALFKADADSKTQGEVSLLPLQRLLLSMSLCDEQGELVFTEPADVGLLDGVALEHLAIEAMRLNCFTKESEDEAQKKV